METERNPAHQDVSRVHDDSANDSGLDETRAEMEAMLEHADQLLDSLSLLNAETYLVQNQQTGGQ